MKKKVLAVACAMALLLGTSVNTMAVISPSGTSDTTTTTNTTNTAPRTGESDLLLYGIAGALLLSGTAIVSKKRLEALK